ncbi:MAG: hypothetical protein QE275_04995 [Actinomycetota bacterium]|nr:hypothetical protein [Actinomycetota bacterium]
MDQSNFVFRFLKLNFGLFVYGIGIAMMVHASIGLAPWDVLAQGISKQTGLTFGQSTIAVSVMVLMAWIPLKVKPGIGSILNAVLLGVFADFWLPLMPKLDGYISQLVWFVLGLFVISFATGLYISCGMGKGPRDGLNTGIAQRFKLPFWQARSIVEVVVVAVGFLLGGQVREGTLIFAFAIGYLNQLGLRLFKLVDKKGKL